MRSGWLIGMGLIGVLSFGASAQAGVVTNGNFENGINGWTPFQTANAGFIFHAPALFDTNGDGNDSGAGKVNAGVATIDGTFGGGGFMQFVGLSAGSVTIKADIATHDRDSSNAQGGLFELIFDGNVVASHDFGFIIDGVETNPVTARATLEATIDILVAGDYEMSFLVTRSLQNEFGGLPGLPTPRQYLDNVRLSGTSVPEPGTWALLGGALFGLAALKRRRA